MSRRSNARTRQSGRGSVRRGLTVGVAALAAALSLYLLWWPRVSGDVGSDAAAPSASSAVAVANTAGSPQRVPVARTIGSEAPELVRPSRRIDVAPLSQRPGESDKDFNYRKGWVESFQRFEEKAELTAEERQRVLEVLADTQQQADVYLVAMQEALTDARPPSETPDVAELEQSLEEMTLNGLREFLTSTQVVEFRRRANLDTYLGYGMWHPLDIEATQPD